MPTRIKQMADIKNKILSKILKVDPKSLKSAEASKRSQSSNSGMDTRVIANIQNRINNQFGSALGTMKTNADGIVGDQNDNYLL